MDIIKKTVKGIKDLKIQGATAIARASLKSISQVEPEKLATAAEQLSQARPTEPLTGNCLNYILWQVEGGRKLKGAVDLMLSRLDDVENEIISQGVGLIKPDANILTHCHSSTVENVLKAAHQQGIKFSVYLTETRPRFQGRIMAKKLTQAGIETTMIADSAAPFTLSHLDKIEINLVLLGCDAIAADGSCVNKIGSFAISLAAQEAKIPLYILTSLLKLDPQAKAAGEIKIEERSLSEIWENRPEALRIINPAFDIVLGKRIGGYLTEFGLLKPARAFKIAKKNYPWIMRKDKRRRPRIRQKIIAPFSYLQLGGKFASQKHILATYRLNSDLSLEKAAEQVAAESSIGTWTRITHQTQERFDRLAAKVYELDKRTKAVSLAYPLALFELGNIPQLLSSLAGNVFGMKAIQELRLLDIELPRVYVKSFPGPSVGLKGIRKYLGVQDRPILASIVKPKQGLSAKEQAEIVGQLFQAGIDLVKDDENLTSPDFNLFEERLSLIMRQVEKFKRPKLYAFNITAPYETMIKRAQKVKKLGSRCLMVDIFTVGFAALQNLRQRFPDLIIHGHRAMHAAMSRGKKHGVAMLVWAKLARLAGIDQLHTGTVVGKMEGDQQETLKINQFLRSDWYGLKPVLPIASGGLHPNLIPKLIKILGSEMVFAFGGGIHGHPEGVGAGAQAVVEAATAASKGISLLKYAQDHPHLKTALKKWPAN